MPRKNKPRNPSTFHVNANLGAKCEKSDVKYEPRYTFFIFRVFRDKCIAGLRLFAQMPTLTRNAKNKA